MISGAKRPHNSRSCSTVSRSSSHSRGSGFTADELEASLLLSVFPIELVQPCLLGAGVRQHLPIIFGQSGSAGALDFDRDRFRLRTAGDFNRGIERLFTLR